MNFRSALVAIAFTASALTALPATAACTDTFNLGSMGPPSGAIIGNSFDSRGHFNDCYNFTLNNSADAFGLTLQWDASFTNDIGITSVSLSGGSLASPLVDHSPGYFSFSNLLAGAYQLIVSGDVTRFWFDSGSVGYVGAMVAAPVPEPETYAMLALGLAIVGFTAKRRKR